MSTNPLVLGGGIAGIGLITAMFDKIKLWFSKITSLLIVNVEIEGYQLQQAICMLMVKEFKCSPLGIKNYGGINEFVRPVRRNQLVAMEQVPTQSTIWWRRGRPIAVAAGGQKLSFVRGIYDRDQFLLEAVNKFNEAKDCKDWKSGDRFFVRRKYGNIGQHKDKKYGRTPDGAKETVDASEPTGPEGSIDKRTCRPLGWTREELGQPKKDSAMGDLSLKQNALDAVEEALLWRDSEKWFKERNVPWKRGWLLYGAPGTGKTAFVRALGQELNMPIFSFDLATMTNQDFIEAWQSMVSYTPCLGLFEDIDGVFHGRKNIVVEGKMDNGLSFDCFLNTIDGVENTDGIFIIVTTNNIETLDTAIGIPNNGDGMSSRPGRIDRTVEFDILDEEGRKKMAYRILGGFSESKWEHLLKDGEKDTGAQFQERCCRLALRLFWKEKAEDN